MTDIAVYVGQQRDGCTFELDPLSRDALLDAGAKPQTRSLFVAKDTQGSFEDTWGELAVQILQMLAGKNVEHVDGFQDAVFLDPADDSELLRISLHAEVLSQHG